MDKRDTAIKGRSMNKVEVINKLKALYPKANIVLNDEKNPTEIVAETEPDKGKAIAVIDKSAAHHHNYTKERYIIQRGSLELFVDGTKHDLKEGDVFDIEPGQVHYAIGNQTWFEEISTPPWSIEDHFLEEE